LFTKAYSHASIGNQWNGGCNGTGIERATEDLPEDRLAGAEDLSMMRPVYACQNVSGYIDCTTDLWTADEGGRLFPGNAANETGWCRLTVWRILPWAGALSDRKPAK
jgi:hypothetical protein